MWLGNTTRRNACFIEMILNKNYYMHPILVGKRSHAFSFCLSCLKLWCSSCHFTYHTLPYSFIFDVKSYLLQPLKQIWQVLETKKASLRDYNSYTQHWRNIFSNMQERIRFLWWFLVYGRLRRKVHVFLYIRWFMCARLHVHLWMA